MSEELKDSIIKYLATVTQAKNRDVARALNADKHLIDKAIADLAKEGKVEYVSFGGVTYVTLPGKKAT